MYVIITSNVKKLVRNDKVRTKDQYCYYTSQATIKIRPLLTLVRTLRTSAELNIRAQGSSLGLFQIKSLIRGKSLRKFGYCVACCHLHNFL